MNVIETLAFYCAIKVCNTFKEYYLVNRYVQLIIET